MSSSHKADFPSHSCFFPVSSEVSLLSLQRCYKSNIDSESDQLVTKSACLPSHRTFKKIGTKAKNPNDLVAPSRMEPFVCGSLETLSKGTVFWYWNQDKEKNITCSLSAIITIMASLRGRKIARHYAGCFAHIVLVNPHSDPTETII